MNEEVKATGIMGGTVGSYISKTLKAENIKQDFLMIKKNSVTVLRYYMKKIKLKYWNRVQLGKVRRRLISKKII